MKRKLVSLALALALGLGLTVPAAAAGQSFDDVQPGDWYYSFVETAAGRGWVVGDGGGNFNPDADLSVASVATLLVNVFFRNELNAELAAGGEPAYWWSPYVTVAAELGILDSTTVWRHHNANGNVWDPEELDGTVTLYDTVLMCYNAAKAEDKAFGTDGWNADQYKELLFDIFTDGEVVYESYLAYRESVAACYAAGVVTGGGDGRFNGNRKLSRADVSTLICHMYEFMTGEDIGYGTTAVIEPTAEPEPVAPNANGYRTGSTVEIGSAALVTDFLDLVNNTRRGRGLRELTWAESEAVLEYTQLRAYELSRRYVAGREGGLFAQEAAISLSGGGSASAAYSSWLKSSSLYDKLVEPDADYVCGARCGSCWIITIWTESLVNQVEKWAPENYYYVEPAPAPAQ